MIKMNKRSVFVPLLAGAVLITSAFSGFGSISIHAAFADADTTKIATLNNAQVSFNGNKVTTVQTYLVDDCNYIRADDISIGLNIKLQSVDDDFGSGISFTATAGADAVEESAPLTQTTLAVELGEYLILYDNVETYAHGFELDGQQFFMLQDIEHAANRATLLVQCDYELAEWNDIEIAPQVYLVNDIEVIWNEDTGIICINSVSLDLAYETYKLYEYNSTDSPELTDLRDLA